MPRKAAHAVLRTLDTSVRVCLRTGKLQHTPPPLVYLEKENNGRASTAAAASWGLRESPNFTLADSINFIEGGLLSGQWQPRVTESVKRGMLRLRQLEQQDELLLLEEAEVLGLANL